jgi:hypothetical protein
MKRALVNNVVAMYMGSNGIANLKQTKERRRVAASALHYLITFNKTPNVDQPFVGLEDDAERACAPALIDSNIERITKESMVYVNEANPVVMMTPALVIVVCAMLGVQTEILSSFESQEVVTAVYVMGQQVLSIMNEYHTKETKENDVFERAKSALDEQLDRAKQKHSKRLKHAQLKLDEQLKLDKQLKLDEQLKLDKQLKDKQLKLDEQLKLAQLEHKQRLNSATQERDQQLEPAKQERDELLLQLNVCRMTKHVPFPRQNVRTINIPQVAPFTIWLNKPLAPGPDIFGYRLLGQAKYSENAAQVSIYPWKELKKCGLGKHMSSSNFETFVWRGYFDIWSGAYSSVVNVGDCQLITPVEATALGKSMAYPFNLLDTSSALSVTSFKKVKRINTKTPWKDGEENDVYEETDDEATDDEENSEKEHDEEQNKKENEENENDEENDDDDSIVTFLFSTNAKRIYLRGKLVDGEKGNFSSFSFDKNVLDENGNVDVCKLDDDNKENKLSTRAQWKKFIDCVDKTKVKVGLKQKVKVDLKFLFT